MNRTYTTTHLLVYLLNLLHSLNDLFMHQSIHSFILPDVSLASVVDVVTVPVIEKKSKVKKKRR